MANRNQQQFVGGPASNVAYLGGSQSTGGALGQARNMYAQGRQGFFSANMQQPDRAQLGQMQRQSLGQVYNADGTWSTPGTGFRQHEWKSKFGPGFDNQAFTGTRFKGQGTAPWVGNAVQGTGSTRLPFKTDIPASYSMTQSQWANQHKPVLSQGTQINGVPINDKPAAIKNIHDTLVNIASGGSQSTSKPNPASSGGVTYPEGYRPPTKAPVKGLEHAGMFKTFTPKVPKGMSKLTGNPSFAPWWAKHPGLWEKTGDQIRQAFASYLKGVK